MFCVSFAVRNRSDLFTQIAIACSVPCICFPLWRTFREHEKNSNNKRISSWKWARALVLDWKNSSSAVFELHMILLTSLGLITPRADKLQKKEFKRIFFANKLKFHHCLSPSTANRKCHLSDLAAGCGVISTTITITRQIYDGLKFDVVKIRFICHFFSDSLFICASNKTWKLRTLPYLDCFISAA